jgi:hypothetical protein
MEELDKAERMPHMVTAELAGARRNRATKSRRFAIAREEPIRVRSSE